MAGVITMLVIVILLAIIAKLLGRSWLAVGLVILIGAMLAQTPGVLGDLVGGTAHFTTSVPARIGSAVH